MFTKPRSWLSGGLWKPKNPHSLEHLKYLYGVLCKHQIVNEQNKSLLVETLRSISEILIWGDQNDSSVFDFFLEKNMLSFFLRFMRQKSGRYICVQLLQTLNILFENISNETSVYYLLSNNHINSIIVHRFDFSDEEVMAYYISFIKTLSLKLNKHTIHFFYNEHTNDFALYTEAIKFFNHSESMVRIAVRTITLNVYKACHFCIFLDERGVPEVEDKSMLRYIRDKTAAPYFSNLVWFIGSHIIELDSCVRNDADHNSRDRLADLVAEHLDHLHYLNDILCLKIDALNDVLTDHLLNRLLLPLYVYSLTKKSKFSTRLETRPHVSGVVSLFLLSQVFLILSHAPLVRQLADIILNGDLDICIDDGQSSNSPIPNGGQRRGFIQPTEPLAQSLENVRGKRTKKKKKRPNYQDTEESVAEEARESSPANDSSESAEKQEKSEKTERKSDSKEDATSKASESKDAKEAEADGGKEAASKSPEKESSKESAEGSKEETEEPLAEKNSSETEKKLEGSEAGAAATDDAKVELADDANLLSVEDQQFREDSASPDLLDIDTQSECSVATTTEQDGDVSLDDFSTASASPFPTEEVVAQETHDSQESKESKESSEAAASEPAILITTSENSTDEEKLLSAGKMPSDQQEFSLSNRPYLEANFSALECQDGDYAALFALCLLYAMGHNDGINQELLDTALLPTDKAATKDYYNVALVEKLIRIISMSCETGSRIRLATLEMSILLLKQLVYRRGNSYLQDRHLAAIEGAREESTLLLRNFYKVWEKSEEIFLDMFEDEFREMQSRPLNVEYLMMDSSILLPPTGTPLTGIDFNRRLPCGEVERARRAIRVFFLLRDLSLTLRQEPEYQLPLTKQEECVKVADVLDLNNSDLIACTVISKDSKKERRFLVIDVLQLILVEPDTRRLGWGVVKFVGLLQDVEVTGDKDDSRSLHITIHKPSMNVHARPLPLLSARFVFDDHIRCMAAKQRLSKGRLKARQRKMQMIARLLELPSSVVEPMYQPSAFIQSAAALRTGQSAIPGRSHMVRRKSSENRHHASGGARERSGGAVQRQSTHPMPIRHPRSVAVKQSASHGRIRQAAMAVANDGSSDIEEAQEATPSPEAHAIKSLNGGRPSSSPSLAVESGLEIQMRDLSQKPKGGIASASELLNRRSSSPMALRGRSSSQSPSRGRGISCSPSRAREGSKERARDVSRRGISSKRSGSNPSPHATRSNSSSRTGDVMGVTSFTAKPRSESDPKKYPIEAEPVSRRRRSSSGSSSGGHFCPKTLTPAAEPITSLLNTSPPGSSLSVTKDASIPKLLPPAEPDTIRHLSDTSSVDSEASRSTEAGETQVAMASKTLDPKAIPSIMMESLPFIDSSPSEPKAVPQSDKIESMKEAAESDDKTKSASTDSTAESNDKAANIAKPSFAVPFILSGSPPQVEVNQITAQPDEPLKAETSATEELTRLAQAPVNTYNVFDDPHGIELNKTSANESRDPIKKSDKSMNLPSDM